MGLANTLLYLVAIACAVWVIYEVLTKHKHWTTVKKAVWIICALLFSIVTALVYYFVEYKKR